MRMPYQPWIDWLKVVGMGVIIFGHTGGDDLIPAFFNPINPKQLGVALFVFVTAFTLANERRPALQAVYDRFFNVAVLGVLLAMFLSVVQYFRIGDINESNYLPFVFGLNVFWEDAFPANPTTWYVGTYLHLLVAWAVVLRFLPSNWKAFSVLLLVELSIRALFIHAGRDFNAYMVLSSWFTVFFLGTLIGRRFDPGRSPPLSICSAVRMLRDSRFGEPGDNVDEFSELAAQTASPSRSRSGSESRATMSTRSLDWPRDPVRRTGRYWQRAFRVRAVLGGAIVRRVIALLACAVMLFGWLTVVKEWEITKNTPFGQIPLGGDVTTALATSASVTAQYAAYTLLTFAFILGMPAGRFIQFLSQNTLLVFLAHMPVRDFLTPLYYPLVSYGWPRQIANFLVLFVLLAVMSALLHRALQLPRLQRNIGTWIFGARYAAARPAPRVETGAVGS